VETHHFLLELGSEEIPAGYISPARAFIKEFATAWFKDNQIQAGEITVLATPRRLTLFVENLASVQETSEKVVIGPPSRVAFDANGALTKAGLGFAKTQEVSPEDLFKEKTDKGEYLAVKKKVGGNNTADLLPDFCTSLTAKLNFPKSMYWEATQYRYARPLRWTLSLYGANVIKFKVAGIESSNVTYGHPIRSQGTITLPKADITLYKELLKKAFVIVDPADRKESILQKLKEIGTTDQDPDLLEIVSNIVEYPSLIKGHFKEEHLSLPSEVLITTMKHHQKYFPYLDERGKLQPYFISVHNSDAQAETNILIGNERVLEARLSDAQFYWKEDTKTTLADKFAKLGGLLFQAKLGNYDKKADRISKLSESISRELNLSPTEAAQAKRAAYLCKIDLVTEMVKEFTELQGVMGTLYALHDKEDPVTAQAIQDHYLPKGTDSELPKNIIGAVVSIADKIDSITGCFGVGMIPSGSEDPFALRRAGNGIIKVISSHPEWKLSINKCFELSSLLYKETSGVECEKALPQVKEFIQQRLRVFLIDNGIRYDSADAVLAVDFDDINDAIQRAKALQEIRALADFQPLTIAFKRVINILKQARDKFSQPTFGNVDKSLFEGTSESNLYQSIASLTESIQENLKTKKYLEALQSIAGLRSQVDGFFEDVMVMVEDEKIRTNRLALLELLEAQFRNLADFSQLVIEE
jgi:glycyl-tRNA synthetase beta chain